MGDRTNVTLSVPAALAEEAEKLFLYEANGKGGIGEATYFEFEEVNYGELKFLHELQAAGIAYSSEWGSGSEYGSGCSSCRFTKEGEAVIKELYDSDHNPPLGVLLEYIDQPDKLREFVLEHQANVTVAPWDNQVEYGKMYRTRQLIQA